MEFKNLELQINKAIEGNGYGWKCGILFTSVKNGICFEFKSENLQIHVIPGISCREYGCDSVEEFIDTMLQSNPLFCMMLQDLSLKIGKKPLESGDIHKESELERVTAVYELHDYLESASIIRRRLTFYQCIWLLHALIEKGLLKKDPNDCYSIMALDSEGKPFSHNIMSEARELADDIASQNELMSYLTIEEQESIRARKIDWIQSGKEELC